MSDSVRPQRRQAAHQAPHPWDSAGKNTGMGCHFLLQCMKVKSQSESESCPTLGDPMDCSPPGSSVHGIFQARVLEWGAIAFSAPRSADTQSPQPSGKLRSLPFLTVLCTLAVPLTKSSPFLGTHYFVRLQGHLSILCPENP